MDKNTMTQGRMVSAAQRKMQESQQEKAMRRRSGFKGIESALPKLSSRLNFPLVDTISSYLGKKNPIASQAKVGKEVVWLLDNTAYRPIHPYPHKEQPWQAEFVAAYFEKGSGKDEATWVADIADKVGLSDMGLPEGEGEKIIAKRLQPFADTIRPAKFVHISLPGEETRKLGPGGRNAISTDTLTGLGKHSDRSTMQSSIIPAELFPQGPMVTYFAEPEGWAVISDVDDTIKVTMTPSPIGILRSTFVDEPKVVAGMPELYARIEATLAPTWFYLSASPYNLYSFLRPFIRGAYPPGTLILRDASWMDLGGFLASLTMGTQAYKTSRMDKVRSWLPRRKMLLVGDSTQSDPEAYGDIARKYPGWVKAVFVRRVLDAGDLGEKNEDARFEKAFEGVPRSVWRVFERPEELLQAVESLKTI